MGAKRPKRLVYYAFIKTYSYFLEIAGSTNNKIIINYHLRGHVSCIVMLKLCLESWVYYKCLNLF